MKRLFLVPRRAGDPRSDWYPWLCKRLAGIKLPVVDLVTALEMPNPQEPCVIKWTERIGTAVGTDIELIRNTYLIGHSVGCLAILHYLERMQNPGTVAGVLCVGAWWTLDNPSPHMQAWSDLPLDHGVVRSRAKKIVTLISDNDPQTSDWKKNRALWQKQVGAKVVVAPNCAHFTNRTEPAVLDTLLNHLL